MGMDVLAYEQLDHLGPHLFRITDDQLRWLAPPFQEFTRRTGRTIDDCRETPFPHGTLAPLLGVLREAVIRSESPAQAAALSKVLAVLAAADRDGRGVVLSGG